MSVVLCLVAAISLWKAPSSVRNNSPVDLASNLQDSTSQTPIRLANKGEVDGLLSDPPQRPVPDPQEFNEQDPTVPSFVASRSGEIAAPGEPTEPALPDETEPSASILEPDPAEPSIHEDASLAETHTAPASHAEHAETISPPVHGEPAPAAVAAVSARNMEAEIAALKGQVNELARTQLENQLAEIRHAEQLLTTHQTTRMIEALQSEVEQLKAERLAAALPATEAANADGLTESRTSPIEELPSQDSEPVVQLSPMQENLSVLDSASTASLDSRVRYSESTDTAGRYDVEADHATLQEFVAKLGPVAGWNLVSGPELTGTVTLRWSRVELRQALTQQLKVRGWQIREEGDFAIIEAIPSTIAHYAAESTSDVPSARTITAPISLELAPGSIEGSTYDQSTGILIQPGTSSRSFPVSRSRYLNSPNSKPPVQAPALKNSTPPPASATNEPQSAPSPLLMKMAPASQPASNPDLVPAPAQTPALIPPPALAEMTPVAATQNDLIPSNFKLEIEATIIETLTPQRPSQGVLSQSIVVSGRGPCSTCGQIHSPENVPFGHAVDGWFEMNEGIRCGVCSMSPELIFSRLQQVSEATVTSKPLVQVHAGQVAEIGLTEKQGFRRINVLQRGENDQYAFLQGGVQMALRPTLEDNGVIRLDLYPVSSESEGPSKPGPVDSTSSESTTSLSIPPGSCAVIGGLYFGIEQPSDLASRSNRIGSILTGRFSDPEIREVVMVIRARPSTDTDTISDTGSTESPASLSTASEAPAPLLLPAFASPIPQ